MRERNVEQKNLENAETKQRKQEKKNYRNLGRRLGFVFIVKKRVARLVSTVARKSRVLTGKSEKLKDRRRE